MNWRPESNPSELVYDRPAAHWFEALPLGNGHLGAMVYGAAAEERIDLTEATCWSGEPSEENDPRAGADALAKARELLLADRSIDAQNFCIEHFTGAKRNYGTNLPLGRLHVHFPKHDKQPADYARKLNLDYAIAHTAFATKAGGLHTREAFASHPHKVLVLRIDNEKAGSLDCDIALDGANNPFSVKAPGADVLLLDGQARESVHSDGRCGVDFHGRLRVLTDGSVRATDDRRLEIRGATHAVILLALATNFTGEDPAETCRRRIAAAAPVAYETLRRAHAEDHATLFQRVRFELAKQPDDDLTTDHRVESTRAAKPDAAIDPRLIELLFQYGRYLLIASSREDSVLPAHLQGVWNDGIACGMGWTCDYHLDINTQMNYWHAETTNLAECHLPLFRWIAERLAPSGRRTTRVTYDAPGWCAHTISNAWGYSAPGWWVGWGLHPTAGAWVASHLAEHWRFGGDARFLQAVALPVLREAARFFLHHLFPHPEKNVLLSGPAVSPENAFQADGGACNVDIAPTCDIVLVRETFEACREAARALGNKPDELAKEIEDAPPLPPFAVGSHGQLQEWFDDREDAIPNHRHTSHLLALYPYGQITPDDTPELATAARVTIRRRHEAGAPFEATGWSQGNMLGYNARLHDGPAALKVLETTLRQLTANNLMVFHPALAGAQGNVYEMDGNTGVTAGIAEMLLQSHAGVLHLLPALPEPWANGGVSGLRARGGFEVDIAWRNGRVSEARIVSQLGGPCRVRAHDALRPFDSKDEPIACESLPGADIRFDTAPGDVVRLSPFID